MLAHVSDDELLERLLGRPCGGLDLAAVLNLDGPELAQLGLSDAETSRILLAAEIARRHQPRLGDTDHVTSPREAASLLARIRPSAQQRTILLVFDREMRLQDSIAISAVQVGRPCGCSPLAAASIAELVARPTAASLVVGHSHVRGNPEPSLGDIEFTSELQAALSGTGAELVDHVIVAQRGWFSLRDAGLIR